MNLQFSQMALDDLDAIWDYSYRRWGDKKTEIYVRDIYMACRDLSLNDRYGISADKVRQGYSKYLIGQHVVYYRQDAENLTVYRILHQSMDVNLQNLDG